MDKYISLSNERTIKRTRTVKLKSLAAGTRVTFSPQSTLPEMAYERQFCESPLQSHFVKRTINVQIPDG